MLFRARKPSAVVVDDEADIRVLIEASLQDAGFDPIWLAANGEAAIDLVYRHQPDIVVLDYMMPGMDGEAVARILRKLSPASLILVFSAVLHAQPDWADGFLYKAHLDELGQRAAQLLGQEVPSNKKSQG